MLVAISQGSGKSAVTRAFAARLGYPLEVMNLYKVRLVHQLAWFLVLLTFDWAGHDRTRSPPAARYG